MFNSDDESLKDEMQLLLLWDGSKNRISKSDS